MVRWLLFPLVPIVHCEGVERAPRGVITERVFTEASELRRFIIARGGEGMGFQVIRIAQPPPPPPPPRGRYSWFLTFRSRRLRARSWLWEYIYRLRARLIFCSARDVPFFLYDGHYQSHFVSGERMGDCLIASSRITCERNMYDNRGRDLPGGWRHSAIASIKCIM